MHMTGCNHSFPRVHQLLAIFFFFSQVDQHQPGFLEIAKTEIKHIAAERKKLEVYADGKRAQILKYRTQLNLIKSNTEYQALLKEISKSEEDIRRIEDVVIGTRSIEPPPASRICGRTAWMAEEMATWQDDVEESFTRKRWRRISGLNGMPRRELAIARELWHWRDGVAEGVTAGAAKPSRPPEMMLPGDPALGRLPLLKVQLS